MSIEILLFISFILSWVIQIILFGLIFSRLAFYKYKAPNKNSIPVSILVCARNESTNLKRLLPLLLDQEYKPFEIILVNDGSTDDSLAIMNQFAQLNAHIKVIDYSSDKDRQGNKKAALSLGIKNSTYSHLLFTDADCIPLSRHWISAMSANFSRKKEIVLGYGAYDKVNSSLLNKLIRYETLITAMQYLSLAMIRLPYMGVGRNLAYKKSLFIENNGFMDHQNLRSGDDDLFVNAQANACNTAICIDKKAFTLSEPKQSFKDWVVQKRRHISTANRYKLIHKLILGTSYISLLFYYLLGICLILSDIEPLIVLLLFGLRHFLQILITARIAAKLEEKDLIIYLPLLEILLIAFHFYIFIYNIVSKPKHWN